MVKNVSEHTAEKIILSTKIDGMSYVLSKAIKVVNNLEVPNNSSIVNDCSKENALYDLKSISKGLESIKEFIAEII